MQWHDPEHMIPKRDMVYDESGNTSVEGSTKNEDSYYFARYNYTTASWCFYDMLCDTWNYYTYTTKGKINPNPIAIAWAYLDESEIHHGVV